MQASKSLILADAHVHIYDCYDLDQMLNETIKNFETAAKKIDTNYSKSTNIIFLTEIGEKTYFQDMDLLASAASLKSEERLGYLKDWNFQHTQEKGSLIARNLEQKEIIIIAGRQIITQEKLEVLGLLTSKFIPDGLEVKETIQTIISQGGVPVLPWAVGKWIGKRGKIIKNIIQDNDFPQLSFGDNSGRPILWPYSKYINMAIKNDLKILSGTDPLPLKTEEHRPGSFGFWLRGSIDHNMPAQNIKELITNSKEKIHAFGNLETPLRFFKNQIKIRSNK